ncbi:MAG: sigma factor-like helix-turn-helix DNA-binding protein [Butyricimonas faecihominis]
MGRDREVAQEMEISVNTVNTHMKRAYKFIRSRLGVSFLILLSVI